MPVACQKLAPWERKEGGGMWEKENPPTLLWDEFGLISRAVGDGREQLVIGI